MRYRIRVRLTMMLWAGGVGLCLHLLACEQQGKMSTERTTPAQPRSAHIEAVEPENEPSPEERVSFGAQGAGLSDKSEMGGSPTENRRPRAVSVHLTPPDQVYRGTDITAVPKAVDPDGDEVGFRYQWVINGEENPLENGPVLGGDRFKRGDEVSVHVTPYDQEGDGEVVKPRPVIIPNAPPKITSTPPPMDFKLLTYIYQATAVDADGDPITFSLASVLEGMTIDPETGRIEWKISRDQEGAHPIEVVAEDG
ncbi:MAG: hypothetical protein L0Y56_16340, partial [Nitrospira sp.]|nr:hypothetical protein [Nitrospira sp.]